ncbi:MAG: GntR family transcriptional regulator [Egibacteraceae bacterium]
MDQSLYKPAYIAIADDLRERIRAGELARGDKLPSEREICEQWNVSAITARSALTLLRNEGLVQSVRGKGSFVRKETPLVRRAPERYFRPHNQPTYVQEAERAGQSLDVQHETTRLNAPEHVAERLGIEPGDPVTQTSYSIRMGGQPVSISLAWEPLAITDGTEIELPHEGPHAGRGIVPRFDAIDVHVDEVEEVLDIRMPTPAETRQLEIPAGVPLVEIHQTFRADGTPVETADITFPSDRYQLHYRMEIH